MVFLNRFRIQLYQYRNLHSYQIINYIVFKWNINNDLWTFFTDKYLVYKLE